jgi:putative ABC transport system ATP-binding protein
VLASNEPEVVSLADRVITLVDGRPVPGMPVQEQDDREEAGSCSASV